MDKEVLDLATGRWELAVVERLSNRLWKVKSWVKYPHYHGEEVTDDLVRERREPRQLKRQVKRSVWINLAVEDRVWAGDNQVEVKVNDPTNAHIITTLGEVIPYERLSARQIRESSDEDTPEPPSAVERRPQRQRPQPVPPLSRQPLPNELPGQHFVLIVQQLLLIVGMPVLWHGTSARISSLEVEDDGISKVCLGIDGDDESMIKTIPKHITPRSNPPDNTASRIQQEAVHLSVRSTRSSFFYQLFLIIQNFLQKQNRRITKQISLSSLPECLIHISNMNLSLSQFEYFDSAMPQHWDISLNRNSMLHYLTYIKLVPNPVKLTISISLHQNILGHFETVPDNARRLCIAQCVELGVKI